MGEQCRPALIGHQGFSERELARLQKSRLLLNSGHGRLKAHLLDGLLVFGTERRQGAVLRRGRG